MGNWEVTRRMPTARNRRPHSTNDYRTIFHQWDPWWKIRKWGMCYGIPLLVMRKCRRQHVEWTLKFFFSHFSSLHITRDLYLLSNGNTYNIPWMKNNCKKNNSRARQIHLVVVLNFLFVSSVHLPFFLHDKGLSNRINSEKFRKGNEKQWGNVPTGEWMNK